MADEEPDFVIGSVRVGELRGDPVSGSITGKCDNCGSAVYVSPGSQKILADSKAEGKKVELRCAEYCLPDLKEEDNGAILSASEFMNVVRGKPVDPNMVSDGLPFTIRDSTGAEVILALSTVKDKPLLLVTMRKVSSDTKLEEGITININLPDMLHLAQAMLDKLEEIGKRHRASKE